MYALEDNTTPRQCEQLAGPKYQPAGSLVSIWAQRRRRMTPWAYPRMRALGIMRLSIGAFLVVVGALLLASGHSGWAAIPLAGAALHFSIGGLDTAAANSAAPRS
jgi:hypothetical protein